MSPVIFRVPQKEASPLSSSCTNFFLGDSKIMCVCVCVREVVSTFFFVLLQLNSASIFYVHHSYLFSSGTMLSNDRIVEVLSEKNEHVSTMMAKKHKNAYFNVKLVMNILGWLRNKGVFDLNDSAIDQLLQSKVPRRMYLSRYNDGNGAYSLLDAELKRELEAAYNSCILL